MADSILIAEKVNLGRALAGLHLEELVLNANLSDKPLAERASLVKGIINGKLEKGQWQRALHLVYGEGMVSSLFDGDWKSFTESVIESSKKESRYDTLDEDTFKLILKKWAPIDVYKLATESTLQKGYARKLFAYVEEKLPEELTRKTHIMFGERDLEDQNIQNAHYHFKKAGDNKKLDELYDNIIKNANKDNIEFLIDLVEKDATNKTGEFDQKRIISIVNTLLKDKKLQKEINNSKVRVLYKLRREHELLWDSIEEEGLINLITPRLSGYEIEKNPDEKLNLSWALAHIADEPAQAYRILKKANHTGHEVLTAAFNGLQCYKDRIGNEYNACRLQLSLEDIEDKDLQALFKWSSTPLKIKADIAEHLDDKKAMLELSKEFYKQKNKDRNNLAKAYELGFMAGKVCNKNYLNKIRTELIENEIKEKDSLSYYFFWLNQKDTKGLRQAYNAVIEKSPESAYNLAKKINDEKLIQMALEKMVKESPERAFDHFRTSTYYDLKGIELAITALAEKYSVNREDLQKILEPAIKKDSEF